MLELEGALARAGARARAAAATPQRRARARLPRARSRTARFSAAVPLAALRDAPPSLEAVATGAPGAHERWDLALGGLPLRLPEPLGGIEWTGGGHDVALARTRSGDAALELRAVAAQVAAAAPAPAAPLSAPR